MLNIVLKMLVLKMQTTVTEQLCVRNVGVFFLRHSVHLYSTVVTPYT
jgi:hypothetical protein